MFAAGSICQTAKLYVNGAGKEKIQKRFEEQIQIFLKNDMDLLIAEVGILLTSMLSCVCVVSSDMVTLLHLFITFSLVL